MVSRAVLSIAVLAGFVGVGCSSSDDVTADDGGASEPALDASAHDATLGDAADGAIDANISSDAQVTPDAPASDGSVQDASSGADGSASDNDAAIAQYLVGVTTRTFVDPARTTPANGSEPSKPNRTLVTEIWYPTATGGASSPARDATLAPGGPFPLVLFVHGSSSSRTVYSYLTIGLAKAGYVVAAADFPLTALGQAGGSSDLHVTDQVADLSFLNDQLAASTDLLKGAVDGLHYAVAGHSTGGAVATLAAFAGDDSAIKHDARVSAVIPLSGDACMFDASFFKKRSVPILIVGGTDDLFVRVPNSGQWVFDNTSPPHMLVKLVGGQHMGFTDLNLPDFLLNPVPTDPTSPLSTTLSAYGDAGACLPEPAGGTDPTMAFDAQHAATIQVVTAYLEAQMRHRPGPLAAVVAANNPAINISQ